MQPVTQYTVLVLSTLTLAACSDAASPAAGGPKIGPPWFTVGSGISITPLGRGTIGRFHIQSEYQGHKVELKSQDPSDILMNAATLEPGGTTGWHSHSGPVLVTMTAGALTLYEGDDPACQPVVHPAGTSFIEPGGLGDVHIGRNEGNVTAAWVGTLIAPVGAPGRIDAPAPGNCPF